MRFAPVLIPFCCWGLLVAESGTTFVYKASATSYELLAKILLVMKPSRRRRSVAGESLPASRTGITKRGRKYWFAWAPSNADR